MTRWRLLDYGTYIHVPLYICLTRTCSEILLSGMGLLKFSFVHSVEAHSLLEDLSSMTGKVFKAFYSTLFSRSNFVLLHLSLAEMASAI